MSWDSAVITFQGFALLQKTLEGRQLWLDYAAGGIGTVPPVILMAQTGLANEIQRIPIVSSSNVDTGKKVGGLITNVHLNTGYQMTQYGIWAHIDDEPPVMMAILQDPTGLPIPSKNDFPEFTLTFFALVKFKHFDEWKFTLDPSALVTLPVMMASITVAIENLVRKDVFEEYREITDTRLSNMAQPNLLINGCLRVWQHRNNYPNPSNQYTADMFLCNGSGTVWSANPVVDGVSRGGMRITGTVRVQTKIEDINYFDLVGKTLTLSYSIDGVIFDETFVAQPITAGSDSVIVFDKTLSDCVLDWVKLEVGQRRTPFRRRHIDIEFSACQRYRISIRASAARARSTWIAPSFIDFTFPLSNVMRINPIYLGQVAIAHPITHVNQVGFTSTVFVNGLILTVRASKESHGLQDAFATLDAGSVLDANL